MQQKAMGLTEGDMEIGREGEKEKERGSNKARDSYANRLKF